MCRQDGHLAHYLDEQTSRFNTRKADDLRRSHRTMRALAGKRLTYEELTECGLTLIS
jgi:hypothetical protein